MKKLEIIQFLKLLGAKVPADQSRGGWVVSDCPLGPWAHENGKSSKEVFGVRIESGVPFCNCFSCGWAGSAEKLVFDMQYQNKKSFSQKYDFGNALQLIAQAENDMELNLDTPDIEEMLFTNRHKSKFHEYPEWWLQTFAPWRDVAWAVEYLESRNTPAAISDALDIRVDTSQKRVCFPVRDFSGKLMGLHGRSVEKEPQGGLRYRMYPYGKNEDDTLRTNPIIWLGEHWVSLDKPILVVEGPFDLTSVLRVYRNAVCPLFVNPSIEKLNRMSDADEWVTFYDNGKGGDTGRAKVTKVLTKHLITHAYPPDHRKDPGECLVSELIEELQDKLPLDEIVD